MRLSFILAFTLYFFVPSTVMGQIKSRPIDMGGIRIATGQSQEAALRALQAVYDTEYNATNDNWNVTCRNGRNTRIGQVSFSNNQLLFATEWLDASCTRIPDNSVIDVIQYTLRKVEAALRRISSYTDEPCQVVDSRTSSATGTKIQCGAYSLDIATTNDQQFTMVTLRVNGF